MARTKPKIKNKDYNGPFPLQDDPTFLSLIPNQQRFVYNLFLQPVSGWSNSKCYAEANSIEDITTIYSTASEYLRKPKIAYCVNKLRTEHTANLGYSTERILQEVAHLALSDLAEYFDEDGYLIVNPRDLPPAARRALSGITKSYDNEGNPRWKVTMWSKPEALKMMIGLKGMNTAQKVEISGPGGKPIEHKVTHSADLSGLSNRELDVLVKLIEKQGEPNA